MLAVKTKAFTLFATHYFELTLLEKEIENLANVHLDAVEHGVNIVFMHTIEEGAASKSFGLQVAQLAGVPKSVIQRAKQRLSELEAQQAPTILPSDGNAFDEQPFEQLSFINDSHPVLESLNATDLNDLNPRQALDMLFQLKEKLK
jgi:DNA mismatch repair protein MutS